MYQGFYINLSRDAERREALTKHLQEIGAASRYQRFEAIDGRAVAHQYNTQLDPAGLGCWLSHLNVLCANRSPAAHLHIIEDDTIFAKSALADFELILQYCETESKEWDLIFTDVSITPELRTFQQFLAVVAEHERARDCSVVSLTGIPFAGTNSYFVNKRSVEKLADLLEANSRSGVPIDIYLRALVTQKLVKAFVTVPFLTTLCLESWRSKISTDRELSQFLYHVYRRAFFLEADRESLLAEMDRLTSGTTLPTLPSLYLKFLSFYLSDRWVPF